MIQIEAWTILAGLLVLFLLFLAYLSYFVISKKLFPQVIKFEQEMNPNEGKTVSEIAGHGIIKRIEIKMQRSSSVLTVTVDKTSFVSFSFSDNNGTVDEAKENTLSAQMEVFERFNKDFSVYFQNQSDITISLSGSVHFEIRKSLGITLKSILAEIRK
jgi:hypothetical protein